MQPDFESPVSLRTELVRAEAAWDDARAKLRDIRDASQSGSIDDLALSAALQQEREAWARVTGLYKHAGMDLPTHRQEGP